MSVHFYIQIKHKYTFDILILANDKLFGNILNTIERAQLIIFFILNRFLRFNVMNK